jgi:hypothetical protein
MVMGMGPGFWRGVLVSQVVGLPLVVLMGVLDWDDRVLYAITVLAGTAGIVYMERYRRRHPIDPLR